MEKEAQLFEFTPEEVEILAEMEYERWVSEREADGWVCGDTRDVAAKIYKALHGKGLSVWMDETDIPDYASITESIINGVAHSKVLVAQRLPL
ncbi:MAG: TIR domain-containing protein [Methanosarcinaceae archaeon]